MYTLSFARGRSERTSFVRKFNLLDKIVRILKLLFGFGKTEENIETNSSAELIPETESVSRTNTSSKELQLRHFAKEILSPYFRRRISWSVIKIVDDLAIKQCLRVSQWRVVFEWRGPPRALYVEEVFAHL